MDSADVRTPYRRTRSTIKTLRAGELPQQPWTAARCQRLLRPLLSHITSWRNSLGLSAAGSGAQAHQPSISTSSKRHSNERDWLVPKKRPRRTYSQRGRKGQSSNDATSENTKTAKSLLPPNDSTFRNGEILAQTPLLRRARGQSVPSPSHGAVPSFGQRLEQARGTKKGQSQICPVLCPNVAIGSRDFEGVCRSLEALLKATSSDPASEDSGPVGSPSLLSMCLRKVPGYIAEVQAWERMEAEENGTLSSLAGIDASNQIYTDLESLGASKGWRHLRSVVRADGINAVKDAISDGLFGHELSLQLISICVKFEARREAAELIQVISNRDYPDPRAQDSCFGEFPAMQPMSYLGEFARATSLDLFFLRQYQSLLTAAKLPQDWLVTRESEYVWNLAVSRLSKNGDASDAVGFMSTSIILLADRPRSVESRADQTQLQGDLRAANRQILLSILMTLTSMSAVGDKEIRTGELSDTGKTTVTRIGNRLRHILATCAEEYRSRKRGRASQDNGLLLDLALFLSSTTVDTDSPLAIGIKAALGSIWRQMQDSDRKKIRRVGQHYDLIVSLISSVARGYSRGLSITATECLDMLFEQLYLLEMESDMLRHLKAAVAFQLAQQTNNVRDLIYAEKLSGQTMHTTEGEKSTTQPAALFVGYCWDDTIGEWVIESPVANKKQQTTAKRVLRSSATTKTDTGLRGQPRSPSPESPILQAHSGHGSPWGSRVIDEESSQSSMEESLGGQESEAVSATVIDNSDSDTSSDDLGPEKGKRERVKKIANSTRRTTSMMAAKAKKLGSDKIRRRHSLPDRTNQGGSQRRKEGPSLLRAAQRKPYRVSLSSLLPDDDSSSGDELGL